MEKFQYASSEGERRRCLWLYRLPRLLPEREGGREEEGAVMAFAQKPEKKE